MLKKASAFPIRELIGILIYKKIIGICSYNYMEEQDIQYIMTIDHNLGIKVALEPLLKDIQYMEEKGHV